MVGPAGRSVYGCNRGIEMADLGEGNTEKLGYLGLGMMGFPMSRRLIKAGHDVTV